MLWFITSGLLAGRGGGAGCIQKQALCKGLWCNLSGLPAMGGVGGGGGGAGEEEAAKGGRGRLHAQAATLL